MAAPSAPPTAARCSSPRLPDAHYGRGTAIAALLAHIAYGAIVGGFASIAP